MNDMNSKAAVRRQLSEVLAAHERAGSSSQEHGRLRLLASTPNSPPPASSCFTSALRTKSTPRPWP